MIHILAITLCVIETGICVVLCLPLPDALIRTIRSFGKAEGTASTVYRTLHAVMFALLCESLYNIYSARSELRLHDVHDGASANSVSANIQVALATQREFLAQRNAVICAMTLLNSIFGRKLLGLTAESYNLKIDRDTMKKQAASANAAAQMLMNEMPSGKAKPAAAPEPEAKTEAKAAPAAAAPSSAATAALKKQAESTQAEYMRMLEENTGLKAQLEAASGGGDELTRLRAENKSLSDKLEDFTLMMGDLPKKNN